MDNYNKIVLLIVPEFPPNGSIGGRRWAKFAKYLAKNDVLVKVIAFKPANDNSKENWMADIASPNIQVLYLPSGYPSILQSTSSNILVRIIKKICNIIVSFIHGGIIQDKAIFFKNTLLENASELIKKYKIKNVICSGPYHRASYFTTLLKNEFKDLNIIIDFRDRWTDGSVYGIEAVSKAVYEMEWGLQKYTCENADYVISTYEPIINELRQAYPHILENKFKLFPHNYDVDDYPKEFEKIGVVKNTSKIKFLYGGTINTSAYNDVIEPFLNSLSRLRTENESYYKLFDVVIYGENFKVDELIKKLRIEDSVKILKKIPEHEFYKQAMNSDFLLIFLGNKWKNLISTKSITYLPFRKPIVLFSEKGLVSDMLVANKLGYHIEPANMYENLINLVQDYKNERVNFDSGFDYSAFSYDSAAKELMKILKFN